MAHFAQSSGSERGEMNEAYLGPGAFHDRRTSRSPHPYHRRGASLRDSLAEDDKPAQAPYSSGGPSTANSSGDSGTEADDERGRLLKGLPAPVLRPHKGLRDEPFDETTPQPSPLHTPSAISSDKQLHWLFGDRNDDPKAEKTPERRTIREKYTKRKRSEVVRRLTETVLFLATGLIVSYEKIPQDWRANHGAGRARLLRFGLKGGMEKAVLCHLAIVSALYLLYPVRAACQARSKGHTVASSFSRGFHVPSRFDPAPLLYPVFLPFLVSIALGQMPADYILTNIILGLSSLPLRTVPSFLVAPDLRQLHWLITLLPLVLLEKTASLPFETLTVLYPLQLYMVQTIEFLTTTSLDVAEICLLATALINLYLFAQSPQSEVLKALLWLGAILLYVFCRKPLKWELALARIPSWRLRGSPRGPSSCSSFVQRLDRAICKRITQLAPWHRSSRLSDSEHEEEVELNPKTKEASTKPLVSINGLVKHPTRENLGNVLASHLELSTVENKTGLIDRSIPDLNFTPRRRHTLPATERSQLRNHRTTTSGRPKRALSTTSQPFLALNAAQAAVRRLTYALIVYLSVLIIILGPIRIYISKSSLGGYEPFGWALGYLLGDLAKFRDRVFSTRLDMWIRLPEDIPASNLGHLGWVEDLRQNIVGPANMRLLLCFYCILILLAGMVTVLQLSSLAEVDTRRKVFHGTMVAMLLPTVYIDPCFTSLALILTLAIFLLLDLFRASQLPPISRPLTAFLAPYVDGRDHRGPIIVSHIFLLIGCAIPLWLSLAAIPRRGQDPWKGWDVGVRDISMISGVVCVGMGDSAASLIGRRYGRHKWYWGGGKSLEGSLAFAVAVTIGLVFAFIWLRVGGWVEYKYEPPFVILGKATLAACGASLTEAVLTGANDNVVVPVVLWLMVRGLGL